jgi:hypothetical protein
MKVTRNEKLLLAVVTALVIIVSVVLLTPDSSASATVVQVPGPTVIKTVKSKPKVIVKTVIKTRIIYVTRASRSSTRSTHKAASGLDLRHWNFWMCVHAGEGSWTDNSGYEGGLQFLNSTWLSNGGGKFARHAYQATPKEQATVANWKTHGARSGLGAWPNTAPPCRGLL